MKTALMLSCAAGVVVLEGAVRYGSCPFRVIQPSVFGCRNLNLGAATWNLASVAWIVRLRCPVTTSKGNKQVALDAGGSENQAPRRGSKGKAFSWQLVVGCELLLLVLLRAMRWGVGKSTVKPVSTVSVGSSSRVGTWKTLIILFPFWLTVRGHREPA